MYIFVIKARKICVEGGELIEMMCQDVYVNVAEQKRMLVHYTA